MAKPSRKKVVAALLDRHGTTYAEEARIDLTKSTPSALFRGLCLALLLSARIDAGIAVAAARSLFREGWTTAQKLDDSTWSQRVKALNRASYTRYQERTSTMLGDTAERLVSSYGGDLRKLRDEADRDPKRERTLLKRFKGVGDVGVDIFFREVQGVWDELYPFTDKRVLDSARRLDLAGDPGALARSVDRQDFPRLCAALMRTRLDDDLDAVREAARGS
jgi:hypothetical protein